MFVTLRIIRYWGGIVLFYTTKKEKIMKNKVPLIAIVSVGLIAGLAKAAPWGHRYNEDPSYLQTWESTNVVQNSTLLVAVEWGEGDWDGAMGSAFGMGSTTDGSGWT